MRTLFLLRGLPGAGKSTWIKENHLEPYTLSPDQIRVEFQSPVFDEQGNPGISQLNDGEVWDVLMKRLEMRMRRGDFTVIDATHYTHRMLTHYNQLIREYRYRAYIVDFTDVPFETVLERNRTRDLYKHVPGDRLYYMHSVIENGEFISNKFTVVKPNEAIALLAISPLDLNGKYERIAVFGDIHGCYQPIQEYFARWFPYDEKTLYVFVGDYLDRGIQNEEVLQFLIRNMNKKNFLFLEGNHEKWLRNYCKKNQQAPSKEELAVFKKYGIRYPIERICSEEFIKTKGDIAGISKRDIRIFCSHLAQMAFVKLGSKVYCITHGGIPFAPSLFVSTEQLIEGVGDYEALDDIYKSWMRIEPENYIMIHGHRNLYEIGTKVNNRIYNLCSPVETGGDLRVLHIGADDSIQAYDIPNPVYRHSDSVLVKTPDTDAEWVQSFEKSPYIEKKEFADGICSYNFTKDAFKGRKWNDATVKARGIFVNSTTQKIVARAYDKFFNIGEMTGTTIQALHHKLVFPVRAYKKYNGFLGLISWNPITDALMFCSKSSLSSTHAELVKKVAEELHLDFDKLKMYCKKNNCTLVCECVAPKEDPHIVPYNEDHLVLLDVIYNEFATLKLPYNDVQFAANLLGMECKQLARTFENFDEFSEFVHSEKEQDDVVVENEGYVFEDAAGFMVKLKTPSYNFWKGMRWVLWQMKSGNPYGGAPVKAAWRKPYIEALKIMCQMRKDGSLENASIVDVRRAAKKRMQDFS